MKRRLRDFQLAMRNASDRGGRYGRYDDDRDDDRYRDDDDDRRGDSYGRRDMDDDDDDYRGDDRIDRNRDGWDDRDRDCDGRWRMMMRMATTIRASRFGWASAPRRTSAVCPTNIVNDIATAAAFITASTARHLPDRCAHQRGDTVYPIGRSNVRSEEQRNCLIVTGSMSSNRLRSRFAAGGDP